MKNQTLQATDGKVVRVLDRDESRVLIIDCVKLSMPTWVCQKTLQNYKPCEFSYTPRDLTTEEKRMMHVRFTIICPILPVIGNQKLRNHKIQELSEEYRISKQTLRKYLCLFLAYQNIEVLAPNQSKAYEKELTQDQKNIRWALNKFYYTGWQHTLKTAYTLMLKEKYCDKDGLLAKEYPSYYQFRYFYRKNKNLQNFYISRKGLKDYQRNHRPCLGDGVQEFAAYIGVGMLDATICDIYLVNEQGKVVGRPILTACIDANSSLCCGYTLSWEGGTYSLRSLMLHVLTDKVKHCRKFGIDINQNIWPCETLPGRLVTDMGSEYTSGTFSQICELGVSMTNLPAYRPELKGPVEKFFDVIQNYYKPHLKGKGVILKDFQKRGGWDYRKDACLTMKEFEAIILHCIIFYNSQRVIESYPYTKDMLKIQVAPYANCIWNWQMEHGNSNLISVSKEELILHLLPRTSGKHTRFGLIVNGIRYKNPNYMEEYLEGKTVTAAYNPEDVHQVWVIERNSFVRFELIESRLAGFTTSEAKQMRREQKIFVNQLNGERLQAEINLIEHIQTISGNSSVLEKRIQTKRLDDIRTTRQKEKRMQHIDYINELKIEQGKEPNFDE